MNWTTWKIGSRGHTRHPDRYHCWQLNLKSLIQMVPYPVIYPLLSLISPIQRSLQTKTKCTLIKIYIYMLDLVTWATIASLHISVVIYTVLCCTNGCWSKKPISCLESTNPSKGWVNSVGKRMETAGTVYLSSVVITSVRPLLKSQAFELLMAT